MNKTLLVFQREYLSRVKKKSFVLTTILVPVIIIAFYLVMIVISATGSSESNKIAVIDNANLFNGKVDKARDSSTYTFITGQTEESFKKEYKKKGYDYFL